MSSAAERFAVVGRGKAQLQQQHPMYHVPQHSRREKLRFPSEDSPPPISLPSLHDPSTAWPLYPADTVTSFLLASSSSSSSSSSTCYSQNPNYSIASSSHFSGHHNTLSLPAHHHRQISNQGFSLSLSSSASSPPPPARHQFGVGPLGPFTGYATVLNRSSFLEPARQLLEEICDFGRRAVTAAGGSGAGDMLLDADPREPSPMDHRMQVNEDGRISAREQQWKKSRLISMLDEVYRRYKQYYQQVQAVTTSFESVAGLSTTAPYASMALNAMSSHFRRLRVMISNQLHHTNKIIGKEGLSREGAPSFGLINNGACLQRTVNNSGTFGQLHIWRPQRGLPEYAVSVLRAWLFEHFLHPYPTDADKQMLSKQTGLTRNQVSNWFINARVRLWKPMVEEIHSLEMQQLHKVSAGDKSHVTNEQSQLPSPSTAASCNSRPAQSANSPKNEHPTTKCIQDDLTQIPNHTQEPCNFVYDVVPGHQHIGFGLDVAAGGTSGVSLTLGLHQASGVCLAEPLPLNVINCFGLEECNDVYVMGAFDGQEWQFGKNLGGQFFHDFVG
ncbi:BEL1-like homeodomain protein 9 [Phoenix dactylifera]|uniref:BEL1-like homeodomain protein 9 n=1 Tax=Phoenix dactylifera TaxID=42345 RepID=A0A8B7D1M0_PHODC|nr:BEL1-like homeodomain protein 9 [Phoenix dactylifera]XP_008811363.2 BEL1-like homeodomain protein 9 [Phoenix dactylifera]